MGSNSGEFIVPHLIGGKDSLEKLNLLIDVISPHTNKSCWKAVSANPQDAIAAVEAAQAAFPAWSITKPDSRRDILLKAANILEARAEEYAGYVVTEIGVDVGVAKHIIVPLALRMLRDIACRISSICGSVPVCESKGQSALVLKEPYGVVLGIVPWNAPPVFGVKAAATAIATGNTTVLKASELSPRSYYALGRVFADAGLPNGVLNIIASRPEDAPGVVEAMISHPAVMKLNFTGSAAVGRKIAEQCGRNLKPCLMELGGKNSAIILDDADIGTAVEQCIVGSFALSGQVCMSTDRLIIHSAIAPAFLAALKGALQSMPRDSSSPTLISSSSKTRIEALVSEAISSGAHIHFGPESSSPADVGGVRFGPMILGGMKDEMRIWHEEAFASLVGYVVVDTEEEAIAMANNTEYGLSAAVFTRDLRRALAVAKKIRSGAVHINTMTFRDEPALPFGGVKNSGWGRFNSSNGMEEFLVTKTITWDD